MSKIVFISDFLFHSPDSKTVYHNWAFKLILPLLKSIGIIEVVEFKDLENKEGHKFSRNEFYRISNINMYLDEYYLYDYQRITNNSWEYFRSFVDFHDFYIGFELGIHLRKKLSEFSVDFINLWLHSYKLFDDITMLVNTNSKKIYDVLVQYKIPLSKFYFSANYFKVYLTENNLLFDKNIEDNSCLFIGQMPYDKSIECDGNFLNITNYQDRILSLSKKYSKIYYKEHPSFSGLRNTELGKKIDNFIEQCDFIERVSEEIPTYSLLSSDKIKKVIGLSSSVLYEAKFFEKDIEYLYKPLFDIDGEFGLNNFVSIDESFWSLNFWAKMLDIDGNFEKVSHLGINKNKIRKIRNTFFGYKYLDSGVMLLEKCQKIEYKIAELERQLPDSIPNDKIYPNWLLKCVKNFIFDKNKRSIFLSKHSLHKVNQDAFLPVFTGGIYNFSENMDHIFCKGFFSPEKWGMWSRGHKACLSFKVLDNQKDVYIRLSGIAFITAKNPTVSVEVSCNNKVLHIWKFIASKEQSSIDFIIKHSLICADGVINLDFYIDNLSSPFECGMSDDIRKLGFGLHSIYIYRILENSLYFSKFWLTLRSFFIFTRKKRHDFRDKYKLSNIMQHTQQISIGESSNQLLGVSVKPITHQQKGINSIGFFLENIGLSHHVRYFTRCIKAEGIPFGANHFALNRGNKISNEFDKYISNNLVYNVNVFNFNANYIIEYHKRYSENFKNKYNIGYEYWEFEKFPACFLSQNNLLNEIWAPSEFIFKTLSSCHNIPIIKMPLAIEFDTYRFGIYNRNYFKIPSQSFIFLFSFDIGSELSGRKNPNAVIDAFIHAFPNKNENVQLIIKATCRTEMLNNKLHTKVLEDLKVLSEKYNIILLSDDLTDLQMKALINCCDAYVSLHRCEGLGLGMMEAMKMGKPVIATNYSGNREFTKFDNSCLVNYELIKSDAFSHLIQGHVWAEPDIEHASWYMNKLYHDSDYYKKISIKAKQYIDTYHSQKYVGKLIKKRLSLLGLL